MTTEQARDLEINLAACRSEIDRFAAQVTRGRDRFERLSLEIREWVFRAAYIDGRMDTTATGAFPWEA